MQQQSPEGKRPLAVVRPEREVAGYFEAGIWKPVTFNEYVRLAASSDGPDSLSYLKRLEGFKGIEIIKSPAPFIPDIAIPRFCSMAEDCRKCEHCPREGC